MRRLASGLPVTWQEWQRESATAHFPITGFNDPSDRDMFALVQMRFVKLVLVLTLSFSPAASNESWTVTEHGAGPIHIGMPVKEVKHILQDPSAYLEGNEPDVPLAECAYLNSKRLPDGLSLMFSHGSVVRVEVYKPGIRTSMGAGLGDTESRVRRVYDGHISVRPHFYDPDGHYLEYAPSKNQDRGLRIVFETDGSKVTSFRAGTEAAVALVEGCS